MVVIKKKKKIIVFDQGEFVGGAELFLSEILRKLPKQSHEVTLVHDGAGEYQNLYRRSSVKLIKHPLPRGRMSMKSIPSYLKTLRSLRKIIRSENADLFITNTVRTHIYLSPLAWLMNIPLIWFLHDFTFRPTYLLRLLSPIPSSIITCSDAVKQWLIDRVPSSVTSKITTIVAFGIDAKTLKKYQNVRKRNDLIMVGNFIRWKGHHVVLNAMPKIIRKYPGVKLIITGKIYKGKKESVEYLVELYQLINDLKLHSNVQVLEDEQNVFAQMTKSKILIHSSLEPEPLGRVIPEGMATGAVVIASNSGGPKTFIHESETGFLIEPGNADNLADIVIRLLSSPSRLKSVRNTAMEFISKNHQWKYKIKMINDIIRQVAERKSREKSSRVKG